MTNGAHNSSDRCWQLLHLMLDQTNIYHHHKETMAHAGITVMLALVASMFAIEDWPSWVQKLGTGTCLTSKGVLALAFFIVWYLIHVFMRWQLRNRRWAAIFCAAIERALKVWATTAPNDDDLKPYSSSIQKQPSELVNFFDKYVFPCGSAALHQDVDKDGWPRLLADEWIHQEKQRGTGATQAEWLLWLASVVALAFGLLRILA